MIPGSANALLLRSAAATGYTISRSLRCNSADSAYLSRTPASAGNRKTWTWAGWVKRSGLGSRQNVFGTADASFYNGLWLEFFSDDTVRLGDIGASALDLELRTSQVFRDPSSWGHLIITVDTTQSTASNRIKLYWNGIQITAFSTSTYPTQNFDTRLNTASAHGIGRAGSYNAQYFNGYLADIHFIDGQALDPTSFGEFSATTGVWMPKQYTGTYGTNGFKLNFSDNSTAAALGTDTSGNGNTWSVNNISVTAGAGNDSLVDVPTNGSEVDTGSGGQVRGNYATLNPLRAGSQITLSNGNLSYSMNGSAGDSCRVYSTIAMSSGKWYCEHTADGTTQLHVVGIANTTEGVTNYLGSTSGSYGYYAFDGRKYNNGSNSVYGATWTGGDIIGIAFDADNGTLTYYKNGVSQGTAFTGIPSGSYYFGQGDYSQAYSGSFNFGQRPFAYPVSGFKALCTANLPAPVVTKPNTVMDVVIGNFNTTKTWTVGFNPDLIWIKARDLADSHVLTDSVRGTNSQLFSDRTQAEATNTTAVTAFNSGGFTIGSYTPVSGTSTVAWAWDAGSSTVTNTQGSISSQVRANASAGFSIVTWTGNGATNATVGHGLGVTPAMIIAKNRNTANNWAIWFTGFTANEYMIFTTSAKLTYSTQWGSTPTSTVFGVADTSVNGNGNGIVAYCFAPVAGYSAFGSYTGNGSTDGPFVYTGFRPRLVLRKRTDSISGWAMVDAARGSYNVISPYLFANTSDVENSANVVDFLSNGFKVRESSTASNASDGTYIYAAFAESPFQYARAR